MIRFIDEHRDQLGVEAICRVLSATECGFITSRGYRAAKARPASARALRDEALLPEIRRIHSEIFCLNITVPSVALARTICQNWDESSTEIYTNVVTSLMPNKKTKLI